MKEVEQARAMFLKARKILETGGDYKFALGTTLSNRAFGTDRPVGEKCGIV